MEQERLLGEYRDSARRRRMVLASSSPAAGVLVIDRDLPAAADVRLLAHLGPEEPLRNAELVCADYLARIAAGEDCACRRLHAHDLAAPPMLEDPGQVPPPDEHEGDELEDPCGHRYALQIVALAGGRQLRWCRKPPRARDEEAIAFAPLSLRDAVASLERYQPLLAVTSRALRGAAVSTSVLRAELARVLESPIVLNRRLRETVIAAVEREELSMSEIAMRCGRVKRDSKGNLSGETSWLARRLGLLPEGGHAQPTPWVHTDVLALIARRGLGVAPREVEL